MVVKQTKVTTHNKPIYFVELAPTAQGTVLVTNTENSSGTIGEDGYPIQYAQRINLTSGACTCACKGFQESIAPRAHRDGVTPTVHNGRMCRHLKKAFAVGCIEWGYNVEAEPIAEPVEVAPTVEAKPVFDYVSFFSED